MDKQVSSTQNPYAEPTSLRGGGVKLLVCYHKKDKLFKNDILVPIHCGRALACEASKDGKMSEKDYQWMLDNMIGDDTGDNISKLNRKYAEMTAIYWAWKNYEKLGNPDYIGFMHYRRLFLLDKYHKSRKHSNDILSYCKLNPEHIIEIVNEYNLIMQKKFSFSRYKDRNRISFESYQNIIKLAPNNYPELFKKYKSFKVDYSLYGQNMFIMRKEDFFNYCNVIFEILDFYDKNNTNRFPRDVGHMAEYLTSFYLDYLKEQNHINALSVPVVWLENLYYLKLLMLIIQRKRASAIRNFKCYKDIFIIK